MFISQNKTQFEFKGSDYGNWREFILLPEERIIGCYGFTKSQGIDI